MTSADQMYTDRAIKENIIAQWKRCSGPVENTYGVKINNLLRRLCRL